MHLGRNRSSHVLFTMIADYAKLMCSSEMLKQLRTTSEKTSAAHRWHSFEREPACRSNI